MRRLRLQRLLGIAFGLVFCMAGLIFLRASFMPENEDHLLVLRVTCGIFILVGLGTTVFLWSSSSSHTKLNRRQKRYLRSQWVKEGPSLGFADYKKNYLAELADLSPSERETQSFTEGSWRFRKGWETNHIKGVIAKELWFFWGFTIFWCSISLPIAWKIPMLFSEHGSKILFLAAFPVIGFGLFIYTIVITFQQSRFRGLRLILDPYPGSLGGQVGGILDLNSLSVAELTNNPFKVTLECIHVRGPDGAKRNVQRTQVGWSESGKAELSSTYSGTRLTFCFDAPKRLPPTTIDRREHFNYWLLTVSAKLPGADLNQNFDIPVFNSGKVKSSLKSHNISESLAKDTSKEKEKENEAIGRLDFQATGLRNVCRATDTENGFELSFLSLRNKVLALYSAILSFGAWFAVYVNRMESIWGGLFALLGLGGIGMLIYLLFNRLHVKVTSRSTRILRTLLGIPIHWRTIALDDIKQLVINESYTTNDGVKRIAYYKIRLKHQSGNNTVVGESIPGKYLAVALQKLLQQRINKFKQSKA